MKMVWFYKNILEEAGDWVLKKGILMDHKGDICALKLA